MKKYTFIKNHAKALLNLIFPTRCPMCKKSLYYNEAYVCRTCKQKISFLHDPLCSRCAHELPRFSDKKISCPSCTHMRLYFKRCISIIRYDDLTKTLFHEIKFKKRKKILSIFWDHIENKLLTYRHDFRDCMVIPVPLDPVRLRKREFNQSAIIAKKISTYFHLPYTPSLLKRRKKREPQSLLARKERLTNLCDAFTVRNYRKVHQRSILLVDDIFTTGSTVNECAKTLKMAGAQDIYVFTLARAV